MANRPPPPMYGRVQRKVAPPVHRVVVQQPTLSDLEKQQQMRGKSELTAAPAPATPKKEAPKKEAPKKEAPKKEAPKKEAPKKAKKPKWDEDMTQKELYQIAKKAGLDVKSRDWKHEIIAALKRAGI